MYEASMTLETRVCLWPSVALRQEIRGPAFLFCQHLMFISIDATPGGFSLCSAGGLICEIIGIAC